MKDMRIISHLLLEMLKNSVEFERKITFGENQRKKQGEIPLKVLILVSCKTLFYCYNKTMERESGWRGFWRMVGAIPAETPPLTTDPGVSLTRASSGALLKGVVPDRIWKAIGAIPRSSVKVDNPQSDV